MNERVSKTIDAQSTTFVLCNIEKSRVMP